MEKIVKIDGNDVRMRASALVPRLYRFKFGRDMVSDMRKLQKAYEKAVKPNQTEEEKKDAELSAIDLTIFENVAWIMVKHADPTVPDSPEEWLDGFEGIFSVYEVMPAILELWGVNQKTTSVPAKK